VTIEGQVMRDFTGGHVSTAEATQLLAAAQEKLGGPRWEFRPGVSYRNLLIYRGDANTPAPFSRDTRTTPPHDLTDKLIVDDYPRGPGSDLLARFMSESDELFAAHEVNAKRRREGKLPVTNVWLWGLGKAPALPSFQETYGKRGSMITAVDLLRGLAALLGWKRIDVPGATGYKDTDYAAKGRYAAAAIDDTDIICVHVEATDEASHEGDCAGKVEALEQIDRHIVGPLLQALQRRGDFRMLVAPDHPTPLRTKTHSHGFVPFAICGTGVTPDGFATYDDVTAGQSELSFPEGWKLMRYFLG
jgi:2,3-bisphosphoglycerate-independent phosphoglycerate mutase